MEHVETSFYASKAFAMHALIMSGWNPLDSVGYLWESADETGRYCARMTATDDGRTKVDVCEDDTQH